MNVFEIVDSGDLRAWVNVNVSNDIFGDLVKEFRKQRKMKDGILAFQKYVKDRGYIIDIIKKLVYHID